MRVVGSQNHVGTINRQDRDGFAVAWNDKSFRWEDPTDKLVDELVTNEDARNKKSQRQSEL